MATKKYDFKKPFLNPDSEEIKYPGKDEVITLSKDLSDALMMASSTAPRKYFDMALELRKNGALTLDSSDVKLLVEFIEGQTANNLWKGRMLDILDK